MEGLIMMAILFIISSVLNGVKKKQQNSKAMPPFNNEPPQQDRMPNQPDKRSSLEDFASEVFQQLNEKTQQRTSTQTRETKQKPKIVNELRKDVAVPQKEISQKVRPALDGNRSSNRGSTISSKSSLAVDTIKQNEINNFVPTTKKALVHAIITTEILGPPKAKQK